MAPLTAAGSITLRRQQGFTYLTILVLIVMLSLALGAASEHIANITKREREAELMFIGEQYRNAIASYYQSALGGVKQFPPTLESLVLDKRSVSPLRHIRKLYRDPITDSDEWGLVKTPDGQITGVFSLSNERMLTVAGKADAVSSLSATGDSATKAPELYSELKFIYKPENKDESSINGGTLNPDHTPGGDIDNPVDEAEMAPTEIMQ